MTDDSKKPFSGLSVQLATPCGDARYDREYVRSFHNTACVLIELGAKVDWAEFPGCADLALARSKIFGNFLRSQHTHLLMLDSDMGWEPADAVRLLETKKDFVGAAGPKKTGKLEFAANNCDSEGRILPVSTDSRTGLVACTEVGMAFMLITKACAERVALSYEDLIFDGDNGAKEYAVFDPFIVGKKARRRLSEDFAFCHRWRNIGGEIYLLPDVFMTHTGRAVWGGALIQALQGTVLDGSKEA
jgi:hypothetical protein